MKYGSFEHVPVPAYLEEVSKLGTHVFILLEKCLGKGVRARKRKYPSKADAGSKGYGVPGACEVRQWLLLAA